MDFNGQDLSDPNKMSHFFFRDLRLSRQIKLTHYGFAFRGDNSVKRVSGFPFTSWISRLGSKIKPNWVLTRSIYMWTSSTRETNPTPKILDWTIEPNQFCLTVLNWPNRPSQLDLDRLSQPESINSTRKVDSTWGWRQLVVRWRHQPAFKKKNKKQNSWNKRVPVRGGTYQGVTACVVVQLCSNVQ